MPRVRHALPDLPWPTAAEAAASRLYSPIAIGRCVAATRSWVPAMVPWRASEEGEATAEVRDWYGRFADGRPGVLVVEATGIRDVPSGPLLRIGHDRFLPGLARLVETVRQRSGGETRLFIQLIDFLRIRRRPDPTRFFAEHLEVTDDHRARLAAEIGEPDAAALPEPELRARLASLPDAQLEAVLAPRELEALRVGARERVTDTDLAHIRDLPARLPELFADAAVRARDAGFDGVELHYAHAYTMASFLSARNTRTDGYGGAREARVRLPREVLQAVRAAGGADLTVGCRLLGDEVIEGGSGPDDAAWFSAELARAGLDFVSVSKGGKFEDAKQPKVGAAAYPYTGESGHECMPTVRIAAPGPFGRNLPLARRVREAVRAAGSTIPVVGAGGIGTFAEAEAALQAEDCDLVGAARQSLADPDWWAKARAGRGASVRRCVYTNYCEGLDQAHKEVTCQLWDRDFEGSSVTLEGRARSQDGKRRLVAPGDAGPLI